MITGFGIRSYRNISAYAFCSSKYINKTTTNYLIIAGNFISRSFTSVHKVVFKSFITPKSSIYVEREPASCITNNYITAVRYDKDLI